MMFAENNRELSRVTPRFFVLWDGDNMELSTVMEMSWSEQLRFVEVELEVMGQHPS